MFSSSQIIDRLFNFGELLLSSVIYLVAPTCCKILLFFIVCFWSRSILNFTFLESKTVLEKNIEISYYKGDLLQTSESCKNETV